jgi:16S rRNA (uracil1498-N3)-methyltransferase
MARFFIDTDLTPGARITLPTDVARHALRALRLRDGASVMLFNGRGGEYAARLVAAAARGDTLAADILSFDAREAELPFAITVAQGLSGGDKMEWTLEKAVELGAAAIQPLACARSVVRLSGERAAKRVAHWQALSIAACAQCGRNRLPVIHQPLNMMAWLGTLPADTMRLLLSPRGALHLASMQAPRADQPVVLLTGPEGGFSPEEENAALAAGFTALNMGPRILRTETAAAAALAMLTAAWPQT